MAIRSAVKTIVINGGKIHLIKYITNNGFIYYELPGGGQIQFETLEETACREFLEETGYHIKIDRFAAIAEEIFLNTELRDKFPDYVHRIHHIYHGEIVSEQNGIRIEPDRNQVGCEWVPIEEVQEIYLIPKQLKENLAAILSSNHPLYLGTAYEEIGIN